MGRIRYIFKYCMLTIIVVLAAAHQVYGADLPKDFVYLTDLYPDMVIDMRYFGDDNFIGSPIEGYKRPVCIISRAAARALGQVQETLREFGLGLKVFDAYRPQMAVDHFVRWAGDLDDVKMKSRYYPHVKKKDLFKDGYIASRSGHTRGSTIDLTIVDMDVEGSPRELDMGTPFDFFSTSSWGRSPAVSGQARANRLLLQSLMVRAGFRPYEREWWHFTLEDEPFPETYFNFPVE